MREMDLRKHPIYRNPRPTEHQFQSYGNGGETFSNLKSEPDVVERRGFHHRLQREKTNKFSYFRTISVFTAMLEPSTGITPLTAFSLLPPSVRPNRCPRSTATAMEHPLAKDLHQLFFSSQGENRVIVVVVFSS